MKITFISNYLNHHQLPFCLAMIKENNIEYYFIATEEVSKERKSLGYENMNAKYDFVIETYKSKKDEERAIKVINESDLVIIGSASEKYIKQRIKENKIVFRYSERLFKTGTFKISSLRTIISLKLKRSKEKNKKVYMLCASAYTKKDYSKAGLYKNKFYKWGYFPETKQYDIEELIKSKECNKTITLLWTARFIDWKHPELVVELANELKRKNYKFRIQMLGCGEMLEQIKEKVKTGGLENVISVIGPVKASEVRKYMENANIFLATSDQNEGWGVVINEAMNSGCCVVGNKKIGAIPYLIEEGKNGLIYSNKQEFFDKVKYLIDNEEQRRNISVNAYNTIKNTWNAEIASENIIKLYKALIDGQKIIIAEGPCSKG